MGITSCLYNEIDALIIYTEQLSRFPIEKIKAEQAEVTLVSSAWAPGSILIWEYVYSFVD